MRIPGEREIAVRVVSAYTEFELQRSVARATEEIEAAGNEVSLVHPIVNEANKEFLAIIVYAINEPATDEHLESAYDDRYEVDE